MRQRDKLPRKPSVLAKKSYKDKPKPRLRLKDLLLRLLKPRGLLPKQKLNELPQRLLKLRDWLPKQKLLLLRKKHQDQWQVLTL